MKELMPLDNVNPISVFTEGGLDDLLSKIEKEAKSHVPDITSDKGRKAIASMAAKVAKSKTYLDGLGKDLVSDWKKQAKVVDNERKKMRDTLDDLKAEIRQPLTDFENEEKLRVESINQEIEALILAGNSTVEQYLSLPIEAMKDRLDEIENQDDPEGLNEFKDRYNEVKLDAMTKIRDSIKSRANYDADQKELEALRLEKEKREEADRLERESKEREAREERIAKEAKEAAELKAKAEYERAEKEKQDAINAQKVAELRAEQAEKQTKIESENAAKVERNRIELERQAEKIAAEKREANTKHKKKINNESMADLVAVGCSEQLAKDIVIAIAKKEIKNISIFY